MALATPDWRLCRTVIFKKTIDLARPSTDYSFYEVESVDFSSGGRMYFTGNEKINGRDADEVRYYY